MVLAWSTFSKWVAVGNFLALTALEKADRGSHYEWDCMARQQRKGYVWFSILKSELSQFLF